MSLKNLLIKVAKEPEHKNADADGELMLFYLPGCPYCREAERLITELCTEHPEYQKIGIRRVNEVLERSLAEQYDYWYAPSIFLGRKSCTRPIPRQCRGSKGKACRGIPESAARSIKISEKPKRSFHTVVTMRNVFGGRWNKYRGQAA